MFHNFDLRFASIFCYVGHDENLLLLWTLREFTTTSNFARIYDPFRRCENLQPFGRCEHFLQLRKFLQFWTLRAFPTILDVASIFNFFGRFIVQLLSRIDHLNYSHIYKHACQRLQKSYVLSTFCKLFTTPAD